VVFPAGRRTYCVYVEGERVAEFRSGREALEYASLSWWSGPTVRWIRRMSLSPLRNPTVVNDPNPRLKVVTASVTFIDATEMVGQGPEEGEPLPRFFESMSPRWRGDPQTGGPPSVVTLPDSPWDLVVNAYIEDVFSSGTRRSSRPSMSITGGVAP
jgi:hypothetical protein